LTESLDIEFLRKWQWKGNGCRMSIPRQYSDSKRIKLFFRNQQKKADHIHCKDMVSFGKRQTSSIILLFR